MKRLTFLLVLALFSCEKEEEVNPVVKTEAIEVIEETNDSWEGKWIAKKECWYGFKCTDNTGLEVTITNDLFIIDGDSIEYYQVTHNTIRAGSKILATYKGDSLLYSDEDRRVTFIR